MSNYYISKCCGEQVNITGDGYICQRCNLVCTVTSIIDNPTSYCIYCHRKTEKDKQQRKNTTCLDCRKKRFKIRANKKKSN